MVIVASVLVSLAVITLLVLIVWIPIQLLRRASARHTTVSRAHVPSGPAHTESPPFGGLPPLGPVGPLGNLAPDADINSPRMDEGALYGE